MAGVPIGARADAIFSRARHYNACRSRDRRGLQQRSKRFLSVQFLFRIEKDPATVAANGVYRISDVELASRLSFFLWSSIPDDELLNVAVAGKLKDAAVLEQQVRRMLADPRSETLASNFAAQWLFLRDVETKTPSPRFFPDFNLNLAQDFERETELFLHSVFRDDRSVSTPARELYVRQRTPRAALRDPECVRHELPARHV